MAVQGPVDKRMDDILAKGYAKGYDKYYARLSAEGCHESLIHYYAELYAEEYAKGYAEGRAELMRRIVANKLPLETAVICGFTEEEYLAALRK